MEKVEQIKDFLKIVQDRNTKVNFGKNSEKKAEHL